MNTFYIWTIGCQMNKADSSDLSAGLTARGYFPAPSLETANIIILNSCAVRQSAEDKVIHKLDNLKALKRKHPETVLALTGCMVDSDTASLQETFPQVDFFLKPHEFDELLAFAEGHNACSGQRPSTAGDTGFSPTAYVSIMHGCNNFCSYCIVPYRRGREKSRPIADIVAEVSTLAAEGVKEVTLLGQNVDSYGHDLADKPDLADLLTEINRIDGLARIRFLTSHPKDMSQKLIEAIGALEKVCEHISLPAQAGNNDILSAMRRGYTIEKYTDLITRVRSAIPDVALSTDVILGFPGETRSQFQQTFDLLQEFRFDVVHSAAYSPRAGTLAARELMDDVSPEEKKWRLEQVEALQERISLEINAQHIGHSVEVLVEARKKGERWQSRTRSDKLVFFDRPSDCLGQLLDVEIVSAGPWSLQGVPIDKI